MCWSSLRPQILVRQEIVVWVGQAVKCDGVVENYLLAELRLYCGWVTLTWPWVVTKIHTVWLPSVQLWLVWVCGSAYLGPWYGLCCRLVFKLSGWGLKNMLCYMMELQQDVGVCSFHLPIAAGLEPNGMQTHTLFMKFYPDENLCADLVRNFLLILTFSKIYWRI